MDVTDQSTCKEKKNIVILGESMMMKHVNGCEVSKKVVSLEACQDLKLGT